MKNKVKELLDDIDKTKRYSMSRISSVYNEVFGTKDIPSASVNKLLRKVTSLRDWYNKQ